MTERRDETSFDASFEPSAGERAVARNLYGLFVALIRQGFTIDQAFALVTSITTETLKEG